MASQLGKLGYGIIVGLTTWATAGCVTVSDGDGDGGPPAVERLRFVTGPARMDREEAVVLLATSDYDFDAASISPLTTVDTPQGEVTTIAYSRPVDGAMCEVNAIDGVLEQVSRCSTDPPTYLDGFGRTSGTGGDGWHMILFELDPDVARVEFQPDNGKTYEILPAKGRGVVVFRPSGPGSRWTAEAFDANGDQIGRNNGEL